MRIGTLEVKGNVFLAPMAGVTDPPFRKVVQQFGVSAVWTEMMSAQGLVRNRHAFGTMDVGGHVVPTIFQLYGRDPEVMAEAARLVVDQGAAALDINMGCPVRKIVAKGAGAALMQDIPLASRIVRSVRRAAPVAVTVKIRSGWDPQSQNAPEFARAMEAEGADAVIVHSRNRAVRHSGPVSLDILSAVKDAVHIPVIGNGGIAGIQDALNMVNRSGCEGVMVGRGALGRPWTPGRILKAFAQGPEIDEQTISVPAVIGTHFRYQLEHVDPCRAVRRMRKHLVWYSNGLAGGTAFRRQVFREEDPDVVMQLVEQWFDHVTAQA
ncbi:MAG: tRNA dihydrouridine synthase DusB [Thermodesulfobacteriota bacterium]